MTTEVPTWEARATGLIICPGLSWEEWLEKWRAIGQTHRSLNWWIGDALLYAEMWFADQWTQALDAQYAEQHRGAMRVALRVPPEHRRDGLSWSAHREAAAADTLEERIALLDQAEAGGWGSREIAAEIKRRRLPAEAAPSSADADSPDETTFGNAAEVAGTPLLIPLTRVGGEDTAAALRAAIAAVHAIANELALARAPAAGAAAIEQQIAVALGIEAAPWLRNTDAALALLPPTWRIRLAEGGEHVFGGRRWVVETWSSAVLQVAVGICPWLPCAVTEAALAARLSELGTEQKAA